LPEAAAATSLWPPNVRYHAIEATLQHLFFSSFLSLQQVKKGVVCARAYILAWRGSPREIELSLSLISMLILRENLKVPLHFSDHLSVRYF